MDQSGITAGYTKSSYCGVMTHLYAVSLEGLGFEFKYWSRVEVLGKLRIMHCNGTTSCNAYLVHRSKVGSIVAGYIGAHLAGKRSS